MSPHTGVSRIFLLFFQNNTHPLPLLTFHQAERVLPFSELHELGTHPLGMTFLLRRVSTAQLPTSWDLKVGCRSPILVYQNKARYVQPARSYKEANMRKMQEGPSLPVRARSVCLPLRRTGGEVGEKQSPFPALEHSFIWVMRHPSSI